ncbi:uncharacterized protein [Typha latifolia]|uniref:uncharacterized protein isoform X1 n=1 Tax=Typha latifolia TaxID=4733 RepID=UPI003C30B41F
MMVINKQLLSTSFCGFGRLNEVNDRGRLFKKVVVDMDIGSQSTRNNALSLMSCMNSRDCASRRAGNEAGKVHVMVPYRRLVPDSEIIHMEELGMEFLKESGAHSHGNPLRFFDHPVDEKLILAVDVDEVLGSFLSSLNKFIADRYSSNHSVSEYFVYEFFKIWKCSRAEANTRVHEFFKTAYFQDGIQPIPGARDALQKLSVFCNLSVVTSRQNVIKNHTLEWIERHYPGLFQEIHFGNHFALDGLSKPKSEICRSLGAHVLIDDNPRYAIECAEVGIRVLLFDYDNSYPWCKTEAVDSHPLVTKVHNWQEVEQKLASLVASIEL